MNIFAKTEAIVLETVLIPTSVPNSTSRLPHLFRRPTSGVGFGQLTVHHLCDCLETRPSARAEANRTPSTTCVVHRLNERLVVLDESRLGEVSDANLLNGAWAPGLVGDDADYGIFLQLPLPIIPFLKSSSSRSLSSSNAILVLATTPSLSIRCPAPAVMAFIISSTMRIAANAT